MAVLYVVQESHYVLHLYFVVVVLLFQLDNTTKRCSIMAVLHITYDF